MEQLDRRVFCLGLASASVLAASGLRAQEKTDAPSRDKLIAAARELIGTLKFCALITIDAAGQPQVRTMNPFPPEDDMSVYMATTKLSRKYKELQQNPRVTLYYANHADATGYVSLAGKAVLTDDMQEILKRKRAYWDNAFPGLKNLVLIKVVPERLEVVYYKHGLNGAKDTFQAPALDLMPAEKR